MNFKVTREAKPLFSYITTLHEYFLYSFYVFCILKIKQQNQKITGGLSYTKNLLLVPIRSCPLLSFIRLHRLYRPILTKPTSAKPNPQEVSRPLVLFLTPFPFYFAYYIRTDARAISSYRSALPEHEAAAGKAGVLKIQNIRRNPFWKNRLNHTEIYLCQQSRRKISI